MNAIRKFLVDNKDWLSNIFAFILFIYEPLNSYFNSQPFEWKTFIMFLFGAIVSYTIGKNPMVTLSSIQKSNLSTEVQEKINKSGIVTSSDIKQIK